MSISLPLAKDAPSISGWRGAEGRLRLLTRFRFQLLGAVLIAVVLPAILRSELAFMRVSGGPPENTVIGTGLAVLFGAFVLRRMTVYPGVQKWAYVLPVLAGAFALTIVGFFFLRYDYSRGQYLMSFALAVAWFLFVARVEARSQKLRFLVLPFGSTQGLVGLGVGEWVITDVPDRDLSPFTGLVADLRADMPPKWQKMLADAALHGVPVYHSKHLAESLTGRVEIEHLSENNLGSLLPSSVYLKFQRFADLTLALLLLPVIALLSAAVAVAIKLDDRGAVLFPQRRMGFRGREFTVYKFRSMREGAFGELFTEDNDPRITKVGRFIRKYRLDELPQVINILRGEMSWIGPRPEALELASSYESQIPFYSYRHIVRPGITGWAAVNQGNVAKVEAATGKLHYDFFYIKHFSPWLDLLIFAKTVRTVLTGFGSR